MLAVCVLVLRCNCLSRGDRSSARSSKTALATAHAFHLTLALAFTGNLQETYSVALVIEIQKFALETTVSHAELRRVKFFWVLHGQRLD